LKFYVNETYEAETETIPRRWSDSIETRLRHSKNASRPRLQPCYLQLLKKEIKDCTQCE